MEYQPSRLYPLESELRKFPSVSYLNKNKYQEEIQNNSFNLLNASYEINQKLDQNRCQQTLATDNNAIVDYYSKTMTGNNFNFSGCNSNELQILINHLQNQLVQKDCEINNLRNLSSQLSRTSCVQEKNLNIQEINRCLKVQLDATETRCLTLENSISQKIKENETLKEENEIQANLIKKLQNKLESSSSNNLRELKNNLQINQFKLPRNFDEEKLKEMEEILFKYKLDIENKEHILQLEKNKNLEVINEIKLIKSMYEGQRKKLEKENNQMKKKNEIMTITVQELQNTIQEQKQRLEKKDDDLILMEKEMKIIREKTTQNNQNYEKILENLKNELFYKNNEYEKMENQLQETKIYLKQKEEKCDALYKKYLKLSSDYNELYDFTAKANKQKKLNTDKEVIKYNEVMKVIVSLKEKIGVLNLTHINEINTFKKVIQNLKGSVAKKTEKISDYQNALNKTKREIQFLQEELSLYKDQIQVEEESQKTLLEKINVLTDLLQFILSRNKKQVYEQKQNRNFEQKSFEKKNIYLMEKSKSWEIVNQNLNCASNINIIKKNLKYNYKNHEDCGSNCINNVTELNKIRSLLKEKELVIYQQSIKLVQHEINYKEMQVTLERKLIQMQTSLNRANVSLKEIEEQLSDALYKLSIKDCQLRQFTATVKQKQLELQRMNEKYKLLMTERDNQNNKNIELKKQLRDLETTLEKKASSNYRRGISRIHISDLEDSLSAEQESVTFDFPRNIQEKNGRLKSSAPSLLQMRSISEGIDEAEKIIENLENLSEMQYSINVTSSESEYSLGIQDTTIEFSVRNSEINNETKQSSAVIYVNRHLEKTAS